jgi:predicted Co/Zn/Cd cation transporter (cation efflux family)
MPKNMSTRVAVIATLITAIGFLAILALSLSVAPNLLAWSSKPWFLPVAISLTVFSAFMLLLTSKRKPNLIQPDTRKAARRLTR